MRRLAVVVLLAACGSKADSPAPDRVAAPAPIAALPAGPVPVTLPSLAAAERRTLAHADGYLTIDAHGAIRWGLDPTGANPFDGHVLDRDDSGFDQLFPDPADRGHEHHAVRPDSVVEPELDSFAELARDGSTEIVILADAQVPARITMRAGLQAFHAHASALAADAANTAVPYRFGAAAWPENDREALAMHVDKLEPLGDRHPQAVVLEFTDGATTGQLVTALGALGAAGVERVRLHRMMGWGELGPREIVDLAGPTADDDRISADGPATVDFFEEPTVDGGVGVAGVASALASWRTRFRYCFEMRGLPRLHGSVKLAFAVAADGTISHAKATGLDPKIDGCVAGAVFDLDITPLAIHGPGHATVEIVFRPSEIATTDPGSAAASATPKSGFWCWSDRGVGLCGREQAQCEAALDGYVRTNAAFGDTSTAPTCKPQPKAWTGDGGAHFSPTKAICGAGCKLVR